ncbi:MAG: hypothetical protein DRR00_05730 [Candidatus Parabeggiatoa sp. nov. 3]|nr:MAG: hypothetical protein DRR00_05730 [Gammaproteobacteria bacterium]RKZ68036.1 MAG: hypothetical protein DRQ99_04965 [Gammaproteobacteria bacterium]
MRYSYSFSDMKNYNKPSSISYQIIHRKGEQNQTERFSVDFIINNASLIKSLKAQNKHLMGRFVMGFTAENIKSKDIFLLKDEADLDNGRTMLYICPECGDIGCGAITVKISKKEGFYIWENFTYENNYDDDMTDEESYQYLGPFYFIETEYVNAITQAAGI